MHEDLWRCPGGWFNIKMESYQYRKSHCGDKTILQPSYPHNGISYTGKMPSLYWIRAQDRRDLLTVLITVILFLLEKCFALIIVVWFQLCRCKCRGRFSHCYYRRHDTTWTEHPSLRRLLRPNPQHSCANMIKVEGLGDRGKKLYTDVSILVVIMCTSPRSDSCAKPPNIFTR